MHEISGDNNNNLQPIDNCPAIYFKRLQDIRCTLADWKIVIFIDIATLRYTPAELNQVLSGINNTYTAHRYMRSVLHNRLEFTDTGIEGVKGTYDDLITSMI